MPPCKRDVGCCRSFSQSSSGIASSMTGAYNEVWRQVSASCIVRVSLTKSNIPMLAVMLMETFDRLSRKEKYVWDVSSTFILSGF